LIAKFSHIFKEHDNDSDATVQFHGLPNLHYSLFGEPCTWVPLYTF
jgi:hypothetical protein